MYRNIELTNFNKELHRWWRSAELLRRRSYRLFLWSLRFSKRISLTVFELFFQGPSLKRSVSPGIYEEVGRPAPSGHFSHNTHPPNLS